MSVETGLNNESYILEVFNAFLRKIYYNLKFSSKQVKKPVQPSKSNGSMGFIIIINM